MIIKAIIKDSKVNCFMVDASQYLSKYIGESEKRFRALYEHARRVAPSIIVIDEIDTILSQRADSPDKPAGSNNMKGLLLSLIEGCLGSDKHVTLLGTTNLPKAMDKAFMSRAESFLVGLPTSQELYDIFFSIMHSRVQHFGKKEWKQIIPLLKNFSGRNIRDIAENILRDNAASSALAPFYKVINCDGDVLYQSMYNCKVKKGDVLVPRHEVPLSANIECHAITLQECLQAIAEKKRHTKPVSMDDYRDFLMH